MTGFILKRCSRGGASPSVIRTRAGKISSVLGIITNIILGAVKAVIGTLFGLVSVVADGVNNISDCGSCIVSLIGFGYAAKPADREHPFGHGKTEYIASMIVSLLVLVVAIELIQDSIGEVIKPSESTYSFIAVIALAVSVIVKAFMFVFNLRLSAAVDSMTLKATAFDSITDVMATSVVLIGVTVAHFTGIKVDGYLGIAVAAVIAVEGVKILRDTMKKLLGQTADAKTVAQIKDRISKYDGVLGVHDLTVHFYGEDNVYVTAHIEVDASHSALSSHEIIDAIERDFAEKDHISLVAHMDPVVLNDSESDAMRTKVAEILATVDEKFGIHDFRLVRSRPKPKIIFEVSVPFEDPRPLPQIRDMILKRLSSEELPYLFTVTVEHCIG